MSWLGDIAGKAENFLNKIDENAGVILKESELNRRPKFIQLESEKTINVGKLHLTVQVYRLSETKIQLWK